jgi:molecular chaperone Hsp33
MNQVEHPFEIKYSCRCSIDRVERSITMLGRDEVQKIVDDGVDAKVRCEFCGRTYVLEMTKLLEILAGFSQMN